MPIISCYHPSDPIVDRRLKERIRTQLMSYNMTLQDRGSGRYYVICNDTRCRLNPRPNTPEMSLSEIDDMFNNDDEEEAAVQGG